VLRRNGETLAAKANERCRKKSEGKLAERYLESKKFGDRKKS